MKNLILLKLGTTMVMGFLAYTPPLKAAAKPLWVQLISGKGQSVKGKLEFKETPSGVAITGNIEGLGPAGKHGIHIHENPKNDTCKGDFTSVGGHFNPTGKPHGTPEKPTESHSGDLGNVVADATGKGAVSITRPDLKLTGPQGIKGRAVIVHAKVDDLATQPTGGAGDRIACGIIK